MAARERSTVVSVRITPSLLRAVRLQAEEEGRSVSGEIVAMVRARVSVDSKRKNVLPLTGWLAKLDVPDTHAEFRMARREISRHFRARVRSIRQPR